MYFAAESSYSVGWVRLGKFILTGEAFSQQLLF